nr:hypothetical protein LVJ77_10935 [Conchiformibius kuhniae]
MRRSAVVQVSAGDAAAREQTSTDIKFYPRILSRADRDTVRQCFNSFACRK